LELKTRVYEKEIHTLQGSILKSTDDIYQEILKKCDGFPLTYEHSERIKRLIATQKATSELCNTFIRNNTKTTSINTMDIDGQKTSNNLGKTDTEVLLDKLGLLLSHPKVSKLLNHNTSSNTNHNRSRSKEKNGSGSGRDIIKDRSKNHEARGRSASKNRSRSSSMTRTSRGRSNNAHHSPSKHRNFSMQSNNQNRERRYGGRDSTGRGRGYRGRGKSRERR